MALSPAIFTMIDRAIPFAELVPMIGAAGFRVVSLGAEHSPYETAAQRAEIRRLLAAHGMTVDSVHAPFPEGDRLFSVDDDERRESVRQCRLAVDAAAALAGPIVVVHLIQPYGVPPGETRDLMVAQGRRSIEAVAAYAADHDVRLALENGQRRPYNDVLERFLVEFDGPHVGLCYDVGHEHVEGTDFEILERFGHRLCTLHVHDNAGADTHVLPGEGTIDWTRFQHVLAATGYTGNLLLEVSMAHSRYRDPAAFLGEAWRAAAALAGSAT